MNTSEIKKCLETQFQRLNSIPQEIITHSAITLMMYEQALGNNLLAQATIAVKSPLNNLVM